MNRTGGGRAIKSITTEVCGKITTVGYKEVQLGELSFLTVPKGPLRPSRLLISILQVMEPLQQLTTSAFWVCF